MKPPRRVDLIRYLLPPDEVDWSWYEEDAYIHANLAGIPDQHVASLAILLREIDEEYAAAMEDWEHARTLIGPKSVSGRVGKASAHMTTATSLGRDWKTGTSIS